MKFTSRLQMFLHLVAILSAAMVTISDLLPPDQKAIVVIITGAVQAALGKVGTLYNPDGTPASESYRKP
jgi:hypothetical protein